MRVSDFKLAEYLLRGVCAAYETPFADAEVEFVEAESVDLPPGIDRSSANAPPAHLGGVWSTLDGRNVYGEGKVILRGSRSLGRTLLGIFGVYVNNFPVITGGSATIDEAAQVDMIHTATAIIRDFLYGEKRLPEASGGPFPAVTLAHFPLVWLVMRDFISPVFQVELRDLPVIMDRSPQHDVAVAGSATVAGETSPVLFVNLDAESDVYRAAFLLSAALTAHGLDPKAVIPQLLHSDDLGSTAGGFFRMAFVEEKPVNDFVQTLSVLGGCSVQKSAGIFKAAQAEGVASFGNFGAGNTFAPQLLEGMLGNARGTDPSTHKSLEQLRQQIWDRVAAEKIRRGKTDMTLEDLLRAHSKGMQPKANTVLQGLLADERIW